MIEQYGWTDAVRRRFSDSALAGATPARVIAHHRDRWRLVTPDGERDGRLAGRFAFAAAEGGYPVVGDWVATTIVDAHDAVIQAVAPRASFFRRRMAGGEGAQGVAANVDVAVAVAALNRDFNLRRIERYLVAAREAGAAPAVALTKADLAPAPDAQADAVRAIAGDAPVVVLSALTGAGLDALAALLAPGATAVLLGSSGAGKSTLLNALAGASLMATAAVRAGDDRGRHTTTHRELIRLAGGALLIDTPGMRELGLLADGEEALDASFSDIAALAAACRFRDCAHDGEPGCAVAAALASGALDAGRWQAWLKLGREIAFAARREDPDLAAEERRKWKRIHKAQRARARARDGDD